MALVSCTTCSRHVRPGDASCPFCGAAITDGMRAVAASMARAAANAGPPLSRAALLFAGATALTACGKEPAMTAPAYGVPPPDLTTSVSATPPAPPTEHLAVPAYGVPPPPSLAPNAVDAGPSNGNADAGAPNRAPPKPATK